MIAEKHKVFFFFLFFSSVVAALGLPDALPGAPCSSGGSLCCCCDAFKLPSEMQLMQHVTDCATTCFFPCLQSESRHALLESTFANGRRHLARFLWHSLDSLQLPGIKLFPLLSVQRLGTCKQQDNWSDASHSTELTAGASESESSETVALCWPYTTVSPAVAEYACV